MGAHIMVRKKGMTRRDIQALLDKASFLDVVCFLKETRYDDYSRKHGPGALFLSSGQLGDLPDDWIDYDGDILFNNSGLGALDEIHEVLGFFPPVVDSDAYDLKRGRGKASRIIRILPPDPRGDPEEWLTAGELQSRLARVVPRETEDPRTSWVLETFKAIAEGGFDSRVLL